MIFDYNHWREIDFVFQVCNKIIFLISFVGNRGTFTRGYKAMVLDFEFLYHLIYLIICSLGVFVHVFFYSLLVRETHRSSAYTLCNTHTPTYFDGVKTGKQTKILS